MLNNSVLKCKLLIETDNRIWTPKRAISPSKTRPSLIAGCPAFGNGSKVLPLRTSPSPKKPGLLAHASRRSTPIAHISLKPPY